MSDPTLELQAAMVMALKGASIAGSRIYDVVPPSAVFPYVTLGDVQVLPDKADCIDGVEVFPQVDVWSRTQGYGEVKTIVKAIMDALDDQPLTLTGFAVVVFEHQSTQYLRDPDGLTRHAAITFRGLIQPS